MRRKDREIADFNEILAILDKCDVCRLAMIDDGVPYIVPLNFGYTQENRVITLYFHSANEGRKIDILKTNPAVCVEMDCAHQLISGNKACDYTMDFESLIGSGTVEFIETGDEKILALTQIMRKYSKESSFEFDTNLFERTTLFKASVRDFAGKRHRSL